MGITKNDPLKSERFYKDLSSVMKKRKGQDVIIIGDFNAKLGTKDFPSGPVGSFARGVRNENGEMLHDWLADHTYNAANTFFKHKASHITTWEGILHNRKVFNQIDYIALPSCRHQAMMNDRSYNNFTVGTDHLLVLVTLHQGAGPQSGKGTPKVSKTGGKELLKLRLRKAQIRQKLSQVKPEKIPHLKRERNRVSNAIQQRKAFLATKHLIDDAVEINQAKDNAQASLALKKLL